MKGSALLSRVQEKLTHAVRAATSRKGRTPHGSQAALHGTMLLESVSDDLIVACHDAHLGSFFIVACTSFEERRDAVGMIAHAGDTQS